ncbi:hypothetical protein AKJ62_04950 [candidate division MSBL1 archaeon SCGC-AAA259D14]|uniref:Phosphotyrosine protein phosphatase I domain-containing protein n=2 Tax=candidate division MSBL1 TaxID=215777 RepID=A0A133U2Y1_9EURY|nr:hypothetical protein AKJ62_04950 [candidate division MSBL1 archaeon SCGC-AAA259D14]KXA98599.1 hypothetical protein AKJ39_01425 [candidate division MSBL1 archaeon SCGC-AAA259J03]
MRILFVCTGNSFRSPVAEGLTRKYKPEWEVESAGVRPAGRIARNAQKFLEREGCVQYLKSSPDPVTARSISEADKVVVMENEHVKYLLENFQIRRDKIENWTVEDPINPEVDPTDAFEKIKRKVKSL